MRANGGAQCVPLVRQLGVGRRRPRARGRRRGRPGDAGEEGARRLSSGSLHWQGCRSGLPEKIDEGPQRGPATQENAIHRTARRASGGRLEKKHSTSLSIRNCTHWILCAASNRWLTTVLMWPIVSSVASYVFCSRVSGSAIDAEGWKTRDGRRTSSSGSSKTIKHPAPWSRIPWKILSRIIWLNL